MKNSLRIFNETSSRIPREKFKSIYGKLFKKQMPLNVIFIHNNKSKLLNKKFRNKSYPTNILTFPSSDSESPAEIYINVDIAKEECKKEKMQLTKYILFLYIHGILHLLNYDHGAKMEKLEDQYYKKYV